MNKTIIININSIVFHIEEDAYEVLRTYMIDIKRHFGKSEESKEILEDIENRIAEMFSERIQTGRKEVVNMEDVNQVIGQMGSVSDFEGVISDDESPAAATATVENHGHTQESKQEEPFAHNEYFAKKLMRDMDDKVFGGVCSGLGHYFGIESKWIRVLFVLFFLFGGSGILLYIVLWMVMPKAETRADKMAMRGEAPNLQNFKKSFEKEMDGIGSKFSQASGRIGSGAHSFGQFVGRIFRIIIKLIGFAVLIFLGLSIFGLFIFFIFNVLNLMGYQNPMLFPPLEMLESGEAFFALLAGFLAIVIPFVALFYVLLRGLFGIQPMNNYASLTLFTTWILSIVAILYFVIITAQDFTEQSTIKVEQKIDAEPHYIFYERDVRVIDASNEDFLNKKVNIRFEGHRLGELLRNEVRISIEPLDAPEQPYIQYHYTAKGRSYREASERAAKIDYQAEKQDNTLYFDSHFTLGGTKLYRDQRVDATVFLPVGTKITIMNDLRWKVNAAVHDCSSENNGKSTEWIMTAKGLRCAIEPVSSTEEEEQNEENDEITVELDATSEQ